MTPQDAMQRYIQQARLLIELKRPKEAQASAASALALNPGSADALQILAEASFQLREFAACRAAVLTVPERDLNHYGANVLYGWAILCDAQFQPPRNVV